jgi:hypothetical protein
VLPDEAAASVPASQAAGPAGPPGAGSGGGSGAARGPAPARSAPGAGDLSAEPALPAAVEALRTLPLPAFLQRVNVPRAEGQVAMGLVMANVPPEAVTASLRELWTKAGWRVAAAGSGPLVGSFRLRATREQLALGAMLLPTGTGLTGTILIGPPGDVDRLSGPTRGAAAARPPQRRR